MTAQVILNFLHATPFRPFTLTSASGKTFEVPHPDYATFSPSRRVAMVYTDDELFDTVDVLTITEIEPGGPRPKAKPRRRAP
jgi:hypothetical protein